MTTSDKDKLEDTYVNLSQQGASLIHHVSTPIAIARVNVDFLNRYLERLLNHYQQTVNQQAAGQDPGGKIPEEHLSAMLRAPQLISEQLDSIQNRVKDHWQSMNKEVTGRIPEFQISQCGNAATLDKIINQAQSAKLLLVEDEVIHRDIALKTLSTGYEIDIAKNGEDALMLCKLNQYDLILMDLYLPGMSGQETAHQIRHSNNQQAIIVGLTNMPLGNQEENDCLNAYLSKPLTLQALNSCLTKIQSLSSETNDP
jgi:CheY-like chemotaxis protein